MPSPLPLPKSPAVRRARLGALTVNNAPPEQVDEARAELAEALVESRIAELVRSAPPLGPEQRARLAALLAYGAPYACATSRHSAVLEGEPCRDDGRGA